MLCRLGQRHCFDMWNSRYFQAFSGILVLGSFLSPFSSAGTDSIVREHLTRSGRSILIQESHPVGQSLSDISIESEGFEHNFSEVFSDQDPISSVLVADLDGNGFDEFYIVTVSSGSGSYGAVIALASNRDKSLSMIQFPEIREGDEVYAGYMGHDTFTISDGALLRSFPIYRPSDTNGRPTGGTRRLRYELFAGESSWQLRIIGWEDYR